MPIVESLFLGKEGIMSILLMGNNVVLSINF